MYFYCQEYEKQLHDIITRFQEDPKTPNSTKLALAVWLNNYPELVGDFVQYLGDPPILNVKEKMQMLFESYISHCYVSAGRRR